MRLAIMQPYIFPYLGYFQLVVAADRFVFYDDAQFIKQGWINRNFILINNKPMRFTVPLAGASANRTIQQTMIHAVEFAVWRKKILKTLRQGYKKAPHFDTSYELVDKILHQEYSGIADLATESVVQITNYLGIESAFASSSLLKYNRKGNAQEKVISICQQQKANTYINPVGGAHLYRAKDFTDSGIDLLFLQSNCEPYKQGTPEFIPNLSIIDVLMHNSPTQIRSLLQQYILITKPSSHDTNHT